MSADNIIHEIRTLGASADAQYARIDAKIEVQNAKIESLRWMIGVLIGLLTLLAILGFFAFIGRAEPVSDPCAHVESAQALVQPEPAATEPPERNGKPAKALSDGRPDRPPAAGASRRAVEAQPEEDSLE